MQRGTCPFVQKLANAQAAGAVGAIIMNEGDSAGRVNAGFRTGPTDLAIPSVFASFAVGQELYDAFQDGDAPTVRLETSGANVDRFFPQVVAETRKGDPRHVVLAGAHLDSVEEGPGINDDGSGTAWQLEVAEQITRMRKPQRHKIRFLWFGGEEDGLVGSQYYAAQLSEREVSRIDVMIDTDMIASPNYARFVYDGDGSSSTRQARRAPARSRRSSSATSRGGAWPPSRRRSTAARTTSASSTAASPEAGSSPAPRTPKPPEHVALFGGVAGEQYDPCYHELCDDYETVTGQPPAESMLKYEDDPTPENLAIAQEQADSLNGNALKAFREMSGANTHALWYFTQTRGALPPRTAAPQTRAKARGYAFEYQGHRKAAR